MAFQEFLLLSNLIIQDFFAVLFNKQWSEWHGVTGTSSERALTKPTVRSCLNLVPGTVSFQHRIMVFLIYFSYTAEKILKLLSRVYFLLKPVQCLLCIAALAGWYICIYQCQQCGTQKCLEQPIRGFSRIRKKWNKESKTLAQSFNFFLI